jgi:hypothetical protein
VPCLRPNLGIWTLVLDPIDQRLVIYGPEWALDNLWRKNVLENLGKCKK